MSLDSPSSVSMSSGEVSPTACRESVASDDDVHHDRDDANRRTKSGAKHGGRCDLILGPMFSGKSTEMLRRIRRYTIAQKHCLVIKYARDTRYSVDKLATHDRMMWDSFPACRLGDVPAASLAGVEVIGIDEGQFFPDLVEWCDEQVNVHGRLVIVAALDGTFQRKPFGRVLDLVPNCDSLTKLVAVCMMCGDDAPFTARTTHEQEVEVIGGAEKYSAVCRKCFDMWA